MKCPKCGEKIPRNLQLFTSSDGTSETAPSSASLKCASCGHTTEFRPRETPKEEIDILNGLPKTICEEWSIEHIDVIADRVEHRLGERFNELVKSGKYGEVEALLRIIAEETTKSNPFDPFSLFRT